MAGNCDYRPECLVTDVGIIMEEKFVPYMTLITTALSGAAMDIIKKIKDANSSIKAATLKLQLSEL